MENFFKPINWTDISKGAVVCVVGLLTVFSVLAILWGILEIMRAIFAKSATPKKEAPAAEETTEAPKKHDCRLIAILTAAVAACLGKSANGLRIRSYRRVDNNTPAWNKAARRDNTNA